MRYEYKCTVCDNVFEIDMSLKDKEDNPSIYCEECGEIARQVFGGHFKINGSCYANDYGAKGGSR